jgi:hypothetical protein
VVECELCGTCLRRNDEPDGLEVGADSLLPVASHRCIPRVTATSSKTITSALAGDARP